MQLKHALCWAGNRRCRICRRFCGHSGSGGRAILAVIRSKNDNTDSSGRFQVILDAFFDVIARRFIDPPIYDYDSQTEDLPVSYVQTNARQHVELQFLRE